MNSNIVLIGFMGSGKSMIGRILSKITGKFFLDTDALIEAREARKIRDIFANEGEAYFRELERELFVWLQANVSNAIISTGGGMPTAVDEMRSLGKCVFLQISFNALLERLKADEFDKRPLFQNVEFAERIYKNRTPIYEGQADITVDALLQPHELAAKIASLC
jgi:shikimate kinase